jgi:hypothetical protein
MRHTTHPTRKASALPEPLPPTLPKPPSEGETAYQFIQRNAWQHRTTLYCPVCYEHYSAAYWDNWSPTLAHDAPILCGHCRHPLALTDRVNIGPCTAGEHTIMGGLVDVVILPTVTRNDLHELEEKSKQ